MIPDLKGALQAKALSQCEEEASFRWRGSRERVTAAQGRRVLVQLGGQLASEGCLDDILSRGPERAEVRPLENAGHLVPCG